MYHQCTLSRYQPIANAVDGMCMMITIVRTHLRVTMLLELIQDGRDIVQIVDTSTLLSFLSECHCTLSVS